VQSALSHVVDLITPSLTVKEKQQGYYSRIVLFAYYHQLLKAFMPDTAVPEVAELSVLIERERHSLRELVVEKR